MRIRIAIEDDLESITRIYNQAILNTTATFDTQPKSVAEQRAWFYKHHNRYPIWVAAENQFITGWASISPWSDRCAYSGTVENSVYVAEEYRGKGTGKLLMSELIGYTREQGFHTIIARVAEGNPASVKLHESMGFVLIGTMKEVGEKFNRKLDVYLYQLML